MRTIILAAGRGMRPQQATDRQVPKAPLRSDGMTLLERHSRLRLEWRLWGTHRADVHGSLT